MILFRSILLFVIVSTVVHGQESLEPYSTSIHPSAGSTTVFGRHTHEHSRKPTTRSTTESTKTTTRIPTTESTTTESTTTESTTTESTTTESTTTIQPTTPTQTTETPTTKNTPEIVTVTYNEPTTNPFVTNIFTGLFGSSSASSPETTTTTTEGTTTSQSSTTTSEPTTPTGSTETPITNQTSTTIQTTTSSEEPTTQSPITPPTPPTPIPPSKPWNLTYGENYTANCIMAMFAAKISVQYKTTDNRTEITGFDIPENATVCNKFSRCHKEENNQTFVLNFDIFPGMEGLFKIVFGKNLSTGDSIVTRIETSFNITKDLFPGIAEKHLDKSVLIFVDNISLFDTPNSNSYECKTASTLELQNIIINDHDSLQDEDSPLINSTAEIGSIHWQAFLPWDKTVEEFLQAINCEAGVLPISNVIPITVGVILLAMVSIVLVAYVIGRRRQASRNNEAVNYSEMEE